MAENPIVETIGRQQWLGWLADRVAPLVRKAYKAAGPSGRSVKDALNGVWLGHPLHPVLTDIPVGAWTTAAVFDLGSIVAPRSGLDRAASGAIAVGLAGAVGAAATGLTDWSDTGGRARRIGLLHGVMNLTAAGLYVASLVHRSRNRRGAGRAYGFFGYAVVSASAYLGGHLVYSEQIGVDHAFGQEVPEQFTPVIHERELVEGRALRVFVRDVPVVLVRHQGRIHALADRCAHLGGPLSEGTIENGTIECPWHDSTYRLHDGAIVHGPTTHPQPVYEVQVRNGQVEIRTPVQPPQQMAEEPRAAGERRAG